MERNKHYIRLDADNNIIKGFSDAFEQPQDGDICINESEGRHFEIDGVINPQLFSEGIYLFKFVDGEVKRKTDEEIDEEKKPSLDQLKIQKINDLDSACTLDIYKGFHSAVNEIDYLWGFDAQDQMNITQQLTAIASGLSPNEFYWKPKGDTTPVKVTIDQFKQMCVDAQTTKVYKISRYWTLKVQVEAATSGEELEAIVWEKGS